MKNITFINAGAGSGKTFQLTKILTKWVNENRQDVSKVLLTTFTKKAAEEIKERTQSSLLNESLFDQANQLQNAYVGTLHSVGYQFIKKYWYLLGTSPNLNEIGENEKDIFFAQAIANVPDNSQLNKLSELCDAFNFQSYNGEYSAFNPLKWKEDVIDIMNKSLSNKINLDNNDSLILSKNKIEGLFRTTIKIDEAKKIFDEIYLITSENPVDNKKYKNAIKEIEFLANSFKNNNISLKAIFKLFNILKNLKKDAYGAKKYDSIRDALPDFQPEDFELFKSGAIHYIELIFEIAKKSLKEYKKFKQEKGLVDYTDMEVHFLNLLDIKIVQEEIKETIKLVMVDEFQDSNPIQLSIFMKLSDLVEKSYWVGDPKQAIYGFRGTDPVLIGQVIEEFTKVNDQNLNIELLKMSWRSTPDLVNFTNAVFEKRMKKQVADIHLLNRNQLLGDEKFTPFTNWKNSVTINPLSASETITLIPRRETNDFTIKGTNIKFWFFNDQGSKDLKAFNGEKYNIKFSQKIKQLINNGKNGQQKVYDKDENKERDLVGSDICILIRNNDNVDKFASQLKKDGIEVNAEISGLEKTVEYRLLYNIVSLFINKNSALSSTELAYLCGEEKDLNSLIEKRLAFVIPLIEKKKDDEFDFNKNISEWLKESEHIKLISTIRKQSKRLSVYQTIQFIINQFNIFQKLLNFDNSKVRMANILKLKELAKEYEAYCIRMNLGSSLSGFFNYVELNKEHKKQAKSVNQNAINLMTYHKAKGLEWPVVILMDVHDDPLNDTKFYRKEFFKTKAYNTESLEVNEPLKNRAIEFSFWPYGTEKSVNETLKSVIDKREDFIAHKKVVSNEVCRLMYVGITRARDYLYFTTNQVKELNWLTNIIPEWDFENCRNTNQLNNTSFSNIDLFSLDINIDFEGIKPDDDIDIQEVESEVKNNVYLKKLLPKPQNSPYVLNPSMAETLKNVSVSVIKGLHERLKVSTNDATALGNTLHQYLYIKDRSYFGKQVTQSDALDMLGVNKDEFIESTKSFNSFLNNKYNVLKQYPEILMEVEIGNQLARGEADLVLETTEGLILIDYKSYAGNDDVTNQSCANFAGKYSGQLELYTTMLENQFTPKKVIKKLIYYVVQGKIVELK